MEKVKIKIKDVYIGKYDCDSIIVSLNGKKTEICFDKLDNISQYKGDEAYIAFDKNIYTIEPIKSPKK